MTVSTDLERVQRRLCQLDSTDFEILIANLYTAEGYDVTHVGEGGKDQGVDVLAVGDDGDRIAIQVKRYAKDNRMGGPDVRQYAALLLKDRYEEVHIITSSDFTRQGLDEGRTQGVRLFNGEDVAQRMNQHGLTPEDTTRLVRSDSSTEGASTDDTSHTEPTTEVRSPDRVHGAFGIHVLGWLIVFGGPTTAAPDTAVALGAVVVMGTWFAFPVVVFLDAAYLYRNLDSPPNPLIWPVAAIGFGPIGTGIYLWWRTQFD